MTLTAFDTVKEEIAAKSADLRSLSIQIHDKPELSYEEHFAHQLLTDYLETQGFRVTRKACGIETAFIAEYGSPGGNKPLIMPYHRPCCRVLV